MYCCSFYLNANTNFSFPFWTLCLLENHSVSLIPRQISVKVIYDVFFTNLRSLPQSSFGRKVTLIDEVFISDSPLLFFPTLQISSNDQLSYQNSLVLISFCPLGCATVSYQQHQPTVMLEASGIAIATVHSILVVIDIVGNCLVCAIIKKNQDMRYGATRITLPFWDANASLWYSWGAGMA